MLSHEELVALVERLTGGDVDEAEAEKILGRLREHLPHPGLAELIYLPEQVPGFPHPEPTAEQVVDFAAAYHPRPLSDSELAELLTRLIGEGEEPCDLGAEELYRLADTFPGFDWDPAVSWARLQCWSGAELAARVRSGELGRDPGYRGWLAGVFEAEVE
jgi:hypothetical protein